MAPEMLKNQPHDKTVDIWSLGVLLYELLHGFAPFGGINERDKIMKITSYDFKMGEHLTPNARDLISKLMKLNPLERIDFDHIFVHPWLKKFEDDYKMDMTRFRYDPEKSRNRSRSRSPNVSEVRVDKQKDTLDSKAKSPIDKNKEPHNNRFGKNDTDDKRGRSNSPMTSNYKSNNLGMKDVDSSLNVSNISNKMNTSNLNVKVPTDKNTRLEPEKKNSAMVASKSYENLIQGIIPGIIQLIEIYRKTMIGAKAQKTEIGFLMVLRKMIRGSKKKRKSITYQQNHLINKVTQKKVGQKIQQIKHKI